MSYILDALKKSEAERSRGMVPTLLAAQQTPFRNSWLSWIIAAALLINAVLLGAWILWPSTPPTTSSTSQRSDLAAPTSSATAAPATEEVARVATSDRAQRNLESNPPVAEPTARSSAPDDHASPAAVAVPTNVAEPAYSAPSNDMPPESTSGVDTISAAPGDAPKYAFSTHVYATDPSMRAVTLDGKRYVEGDTIEPGVRIKDITETGVVLDIDGRLVSVDVLQDWR